MVRNKAKNFPGPKGFKDPKAKAKKASLRPNGEINSRPQERMAGEND